MRRGLFLMPLLLTSLEAKTFADIGHTFDIAEESFLTMISRRMQQAKADGKLEGMEKEIKKRVQERVMHPVAVKNMTKTEEGRSWYFDPSLTLENDIRDHQSHILYPRGTKVNPLDKVSWGEPMVFIDGEDEEQIAWALKQGGRIVLVKGSPIELYRKKGQRFYFDQGGKITEKFQIRHVPARITQENKKLLIEEVTVREDDQQKPKP
jgi:conjugal transfer pilus assembly protein TraW